MHWWDGLEFKCTDPDLDFLAVSNRLSCVSEGIGPELLREFFCFRDKGLVEWRYRYFFCPDCLCDDVAVGRLPTWRKSWCYTNSCVCPVHDRELARLTNTPRYAKAWDAFVQSCNSDLSSSSVKSKLFFRFCSSTFMKVDCALACNKGDQNGLLIHLFNSLFKIFLQCPYRGSRGGSARLHFQSKKDARVADAASFEQSIVLGAATADQSSRFGSLIFAASLLDIIPGTRFLEFTDLCEKRVAGMLMPKDLHRAAAFPYVDMAGYEALRGCLGPFPRKKFPLLDRHLQLQESLYSKYGVMGKYPFGYS